MLMVSNKQPEPIWLLGIEAIEANIFMYAQL